jgi:N utilization substance protein A
MKNPFLEALLAMEEQKGIKREAVLETIKDALYSAYKKNFGHVEKNIEIQINPYIGEVKIMAIKEVVKEVKEPNLQIRLEDALNINENVKLGDIIKVEVTPKDFGRIAAQTAKQVMMQRIKEMEKDLLFEEYAKKVGEVVTGVVQRIEKGVVYVDVGKIEAVLPPREQIAHETYHVGQRLKIYILDVRRTAKGPDIIVSRTFPELLRKLFEQEVPEIYEGLVKVHAVAREPGLRAKIAVSSTDKNIDPIGACVGIRGSRVQAVTDALAGEKIDIVHYSDDPCTFLTNALNPAKILKVDLEEETHTATVIVPDDNLSIAIGKEGQNVRLAARLTGWKIDIRGEQWLKEQEEGKDERDSDS